MGQFGQRVTEQWQKRKTKSLSEGEYDFIAGRIGQNKEHSKDAVYWKEVAKNLDENKWRRGLEQAIIGLVLWIVLAVFFGVNYMIVTTIASMVVTIFLWGGGGYPGLLHLIQKSNRESNIIEVVENYRRSAMFVGLFIAFHQVSNSLGF